MSKSKARRKGEHPIEKVVSSTVFDAVLLAQQDEIKPKAKKPVVK